MRGTSPPFSTPLYSTFINPSAPELASGRLEGTSSGIVSTPHLTEAGKSWKLQSIDGVQTSISQILTHQGRFPPRLNAAICDIKHGPKTASRECPWSPVSTLLCGADLQQNPD